MGFEDGVKALLGDVLLGGQFLEVLGRGFAADKSVGVLAEGSPIDYKQWVTNALITVFPIRYLPSCIRSIQWLVVARRLAIDH
jgi:hypothetical protein